MPSAAAIANAVFDATGIRFRELPITSDKLREALNGPDAERQAAPPKKKKRGKWWSAVRRAVRRGAGHRGQRLAVAGGDRAGGDARRRTWSAATLERGRQLAAAGDCAVCHTASEGATNAGGLAMATPFGTLYSTNITPDVATGIGNWSFTAFDRAMRQGIARDGRHLYPAFPYTAFSKMTDGDMQALYAYLMSQPAVRQSNPANQMRFPFNLRPLMAGWNALFLRQGNFNPIRNKARSGIAAPIWSTGSATAPPAIRRAIWGRKGRRGFPGGDGGRMGSAGAESIGQCGQALDRGAAVSVLPQRAFCRARRGGRADGAGGQRTGDVAAERFAGDGQLCDVAEHQGDAECGTAGAVGGPCLAGGGSWPASGCFRALARPATAPPAGHSCSASARIWPITPISSAIAPIT